jgi:hypothetical protein
LNLGFQKVEQKVVQKEKMARVSFGITASLLIVLFLPYSPASSDTPHGKIKVALFLDAGLRPKKEFIQKLSDQRDFHVLPVNSNDIKQGCLGDVDVLVVPGGSLRSEANALDPGGRDRIRDFVKGGGIYLGLCAGGYLATDASERYLGLLPMNILDRAHWHRGETRVNIEINRLGAEVFEYPTGQAELIYSNGPILGYRAAGDRTQIRTLATFQDEIVAPGGTPGLMKGAPAMVTARFGRGILTVISPQADRTTGFERFVPNAIRWMYKQEHPDYKYTANTATAG